MNSLASASGLCLPLLSALLVCSVQAQPLKDQAWIDTRQALLIRERDLQSTRIEEFNQGAREGLQTSINHVFDWIKDKGNELLVLSGDPASLMQSLVNQNLEMYKQAAKGDWTEYSNKLTETIYGKLIDNLPENLGWLGELPTIVKLGLDVRTVARLTQQAQVIDAVQVRLETMQSLMDKAQRSLNERKNATGPPSLVADDQALKDIEDYLANFPIHLQPIPENADRAEINNPTNGDANGAELDKALNENMTSKFNWRLAQRFTSG